MGEEIKKIKIDPWSIVKIIFIIIGLWLVYYLRDIVLIIIAALFLAAIISPIVDWFEKKKIPRTLGASLIYLVVIGIIIGIVFAIGPIIKSEGKLFVENLPNFLRPFLAISGEEEFNFTKWLTEKNKAITSFVSGAAGTIFGLFMVFLIVFYVSVQKQAMKELVPIIIPEKYRDFVRKFLITSQEKIGAWGRAMLILCLVVFILIYSGLLILGVRFSLILAVIAGLTEIIPWIGPWLGAIPAVIVGFTMSPLKGVLVAVLYFIVQQIENYFIVPSVMRRAIGINPLLTIIALLVGGKIAGPWGAILVIPIITVVSILIHELKELKKKESPKNI